MAVFYLRILAGNSSTMVFGFSSTWKVLAAHRQGFSPTIGYELNPWLVRLSRFYAWRAGLHEEVSYRREDLWKACSNISSANKECFTSEWYSFRWQLANSWNDTTHIC
jgi:hypothetical protein